MDIFPTLALMFRPETMNVIIGKKMAGRSHFLQQGSRGGFLYWGKGKGKGGDLPLETGVGEERKETERKTERGRETEEADGAFAS